MSTDRQDRDRRAGADPVRFLAPAGGDEDGSQGRAEAMCEACVDIKRFSQVLTSQFVPLKAICSECPLPPPYNPGTQMDLITLFILSSACRYCP